MSAVSVSFDSSDSGSEADEDQEAREIREAFQTNEADFSAGVDNLFGELLVFKQKFEESTPLDAQLATMNKIGSGDTREMEAEEARLAAELAAQAAAVQAAAVKQAQRDAQTPAEKEKQRANKRAKMVVIPVRQRALTMQRDGELPNALAFGRAEVLWASGEWADAGVLYKAAMLRVEEQEKEEREQEKEEPSSQ